MKKDPYANDIVIQKDVFDRALTTLTSIIVDLTLETSDESVRKYLLGYSDGLAKVKRFIREYEIPREWVSITKVV